MLPLCVSVFLCLSPPFLPSRFFLTPSLVLHYVAEDDFLPLSSFFIVFPVLQLQAHPAIPHPVLFLSQDLTVWFRLAFKPEATVLKQAEMTGMRHHAKPEATTLLM